MSFKVKGHRLDRRVGLAEQRHRHRPAVDQQVVRTVTRDAATLEKRRHQEVRIEGPELLGDHVGLDRVVTAQRRIGSADDDRLDRRALFGQYLLLQTNTAGAGKVSAATLESSNVDLATEFTGMITTQRAYSAASKIITTADEMLEELIRIKR